MNNIFFYIFIILFLIYYFIRAAKTLTKFHIQDDVKTFLHKLEMYYVDNKLYLFFIVCIYMFFCYILFIIIRKQNLGISIDFYNQINISKQDIFKLLCLILCMQYYFKILNLLFYDYMIKLHYYLSTFKNYERITEIIRENDTIISDFFRTSYLFNYKMTLTKKAFILDQRDDIRSNESYNDEERKVLVRERLRFAFICWKFFRKNNYLKYIPKVSFFIVNKLNYNLSKILYHLPFSILIISLFYDLCNGYLYYFYFCLFYYYITNLIKKVRTFYYNKDPVLDYEIKNHFYSTKMEYSKKTEIFYKENITFMDLFLLDDFSKDVIKNYKEITNYIIHDFRVYYVIEREKYMKHLRDKYKRIHILILYVGFNIYMYINLHKYNIIIPYENIKISLWYITLLLLITTIYIHKKIFIIEDKNNKEVRFSENLSYKKYYYIILLCGIIPTLLIVLKNKITLNPNEIIVGIQDIIYIEETFSIEEKKHYLQIYMNHFTNILNKTMGEIANIIEVISTKIDEKTSLSKIRDMIQENMTNNSTIEKSTIIEQIQKGIDNIINYIKKLW